MTDTTGTDINGRRTLLDRMNEGRARRCKPRQKPARSMTLRVERTNCSRPAQRGRHSTSRVNRRKCATPYGSWIRSRRNCLLARRLVEAGVPLTTLYSFGNRDWDTHGNNFNDLKNTLAPHTDRGVLGWLLSDLDARGLLDETLVVWMGDMGRTPRVNKGARPRSLVRSATRWCWPVPGSSRARSTVPPTGPPRILRRTRSVPRTSQRRFTTASASTHAVK